MTASNRQILQYGYAARKSNRVVAQVGNVSIEDMAAHISFDGGVGSQESFMVPNPITLQMLEVQGAHTAAIRQAVLEYIDTPDDMTPSILQLSSHWKNMTVNTQALRTVVAKGFNLFQRNEDAVSSYSKDYGIDETGFKGGTSDVVGMSFFQQAVVEGRSARQEKMQVACAILSRFVPGFRFLPAIWHGDTAPVYEAEPAHGERPMQVLDTLLQRVKTEPEGDSLLDRLSGEAAQVMAASAAWERFIATIDSRVPKGKKTVYLTERTAKIMCELLLYMKPALTRKVVLGWTTSLHVRDVQTLLANYKAVELLNGMLCPNHQWSALVRKYMVEGATGRFKITFDPCITRTEYDPFATSAINLAGVSVPIFSPSGAVMTQPMPLMHPDYAENQLKTFYRSTRGLDEMVSNEDTIIEIGVGADPLLVETFENAKSLIRDRMSTFEYLRQTEKAGNAKNDVIAAMSELLCTENDNGISYGKMMNIKAFVPLSGAVLKNGGMITGLEGIEGYSIGINKTEEMTISTDVAFPWNEDFRNQLSDYYLRPTSGTYVTPWTAGGA